MNITKENIKNTVPILIFTWTFMIIIIADMCIFRKFYYDNHIAIIYCVVAMSFTIYAFYIYKAYKKIMYYYLLLPLLLIFLVFVVDYYVFSDNKNFPYDKSPLVAVTFKRHEPNEQTLTFIGMRHVASQEYYKYAKNIINSNENEILLYESAPTVDDFSSKTGPLFGFPLYRYYHDLTFEPEKWSFAFDESRASADLPQDDADRIVDQYYRQNIAFTWCELNKHRDNYLLNVINTSNNKNIVVTFGYLHLASIYHRLIDAGWTDAGLSIFPEDAQPINMKGYCDHPTYLAQIEAFFERVGGKWLTTDIQ